MAILFHSNTKPLATNPNENKGPALEAALTKVQSQKFHKWRNQRSGDPKR